MTGTAGPRYALFPTALGPCGIAWRDGRVIGTRLPDADPALTGRGLARRHGAVPGEPPAAVAAAIAAIAALLEGGRTDLAAIDCDLDEADPFAVRVYAAARAIPAGETRTYGAVAEALGDGALARRVGRALSRNPLPIVVPCHRVIGADGRLVGFSAPGGVGTKLRMLAIEGVRIGGAPGLFDDLPLATRPSR